MKKLTISFLLIFLLSLPLLFAEKLNDSSRYQAQKILIAFLLNKKLVAKVTFPASKHGINLDLRGNWDHKDVSHLIKDRGVGIDVGEAAIVTEINIKGDLIEIQLKGGGYGTFGHMLTENEYKRKSRSVSGKASGGSRINLRFNRQITMEDIDDLEKFASYLEPLLDTSVLKKDVPKKEMPEEFKNATAKNQVVSEMNKSTEFATNERVPNPNSCGNFCQYAVLHIRERNGVRCITKATQPCFPYACLNDSECATSCETDYECAVGNICSQYHHQCAVVTYRCDPNDFTQVIRSDGERISCTPYICKAGSCMTRCSVTTECALNYVCDTMIQSCVDAKTK